MDNGIYVTLGKQITLFREMDMTANNIANTNTTGYNAEHIHFNTYLTHDKNQGVKNPLQFANHIRGYRDTEEGPLTVTGNDLDVAIKGDGYFTIQTPAGIRYTRAGQFERDKGGVLVTQDGYPVLDVAGQQIVFADDANNIKIGSTGNIKVNNQDFTSLGVVQFANPQLLERLDNKLYKSEVPGIEAPDAIVAQGTLESSNVKAVTELTNMISISRSVTEVAKFVEVMYDLQRKTSNTYAQQQ